MQPDLEADTAAFAPGSITPSTGMCGYWALRVGRQTLLAVLQATTSILMGVLFTMRAAARTV